MPDKTLRVLVSGKVQGVFYRASTRDRGRQLGLSGWVCNLDDGRVEALLGGPEEQVEQMLDWMREGPPAARVDNLTTEPSSESLPDGFEVR